MHSVCFFFYSKRTSSNDTGGISIAKEDLYNGPSGASGCDLSGRLEEDGINKRNSWRGDEPTRGLEPAFFEPFDDVWFPFGAGDNNFLAIC